MNNIQLLTQPTPPSLTVKPVELYIFIDPLDPKAYNMMSLIRKLHLQYGHYFTSRFVLGTELSSLNCIASRLKGCWSGAELDIAHPVLPSIAIKAAELQGKRAGMRYLTKLQQHAMLKTMNINSHTALMQIAKEAQLDMKEFETDFGSQEAARAFQCDLYITREMEVHEVPSIVFFNECIEEEGLSVSGTYDYTVYEHILQELIGEQLVEQPLPPLEQLFVHFDMLSTEEVARIYNEPVSIIERELKKCMLQQKLERIQSEFAIFWRAKQTIQA
jgi:hypothetical protein